jgi:hypothetical protein
MGCQHFPFRKVVVDFFCPNPFGYFAPTYATHFGVVYASYFGVNYANMIVMRDVFGNRFRSELCHFLTDAMGRQT